LRAAGTATVGVDGGAASQTDGEKQ
jgi:hypothetical protein